MKKYLVSRPQVNAQYVMQWTGDNIEQFRAESWNLEFYQFEENDNGNLDVFKWNSDHLCSIPLNWWFAGHVPLEQPNPDPTYYQVVNENESWQFNENN